MTTQIQYAGLSLLGVAALFLVGLGITTAVSQAAAAPERVIVTFEHEVSGASKAALKDKGARVLKELPIVHGAVVYIPEQAMSALGSIDGVKSVEKDARVFALHHRDGHSGGPGGGGDSDGGGDDSPTQPAQSLEWGVDRIDADLAWSTSLGTGVKVAIIDTGIDKDHEDLAGNIKSGVNFVASRNGPPWARNADPDDWDDDNGHGTHVAGIVAAIDNSIGVVGTAPEAHLYGVKVLDSSGSGYLSDVIDGIGWSVNNGMDVVNMSLGCDCHSSSLKDAVDTANAAGVVLVAAAGNSGDGNASTNDVMYPAKYTSVIAVGATDINDDTPSWSSEGAEVEFTAPGVSIRSTWNDGLYKTISGTSMASPHVAGTVALVLGTDVSGSGFDSDSDNVWDPEEVRAALQATADDLGASGHDNHYGHGLVDAEGSVTAN